MRHAIIMVFFLSGDETEHVVVRRSSHCHSSSENPNPTPPERKTTCLVSSSPNKLSEELVRLAVTIFHKLNKTTTTDVELELSGTSSSSKLNISSCIGPRSLVPKVSVSVNGAAAAMSPLKNRRASSTKGGGHGGAEKEAAAAGTGCQRRFVEFTRASVDVARISLCLVDIKNLR